MDRLLVLARAMRKSMTPYERKLWYDFLSKYSVRIVRQKIFGHYILDFYCKQAKVAIELDDSQHYGDVGKRNDAVRTKFLEEQVQKSFESEVRTTKIVSIFAGIAILISMLGLLAMSTYFIQQRSQEVAIRKVFGSDNRGVLFRLISSFLVYVGFAFIIATPIIWYFMNQWLSDYSYRISLNPLIFIAAGVFCLLISFVTVFFQSYKAANTNPVNSIANK